MQSSIQSGNEFNGMTGKISTIPTLALGFSFDFIMYVLDQGGQLYAISDSTISAQLVSSNVPVSNSTAKLTNGYFNFSMVSVN